MKISHIEHIGIAVPNLEEAIKYYEEVLGLKCYKKEVVADQKVTTAFIKVGDVKIELLEATSPDSTIAKFIEKNGGRGGMHHMAFAIEDGVANALSEAEEKGSASGRRRAAHRLPSPEKHTACSHRTLRGSQQIKIHITGWPDAPVSENLRLKC